MRRYNVKHTYFGFTATEVLGFEQAMRYAREDSYEHQSGTVEVLDARTGKTVSNWSQGRDLMDFSALADAAAEMDE